MSRRFGGRWQGAALMLALATTLLASCSAPGLPPLPWQARTPQPLPDAQQVLYVSMREGMRVADLDPRRLSDVRSDMAHVTPLLYSTLFTFDARLRPIHALASGYTVSADGLRYTFHLRSDARFADGAPITSREVAFSLQRLLDPCDGSGYAFVFFSLQGALTYTTQSCNASFPTLPTPLPLIGHALLTPDPSTLVIVLAQPDAALLAKLAEPYSGVVEQSVVQRYGDGWVKHLADGGGQGTSGMYAVASAQGVVNEGTQLTFVRASHYWGAAPRLREVIVRPYQSAIELASHGDDLVLGSGRSPEFVEPTQLPTLSKLPGYHHAPARDEDYLLLNPTSTGLTDPRARQALALALNRTALAALFGGVATNHLIPHNTGAYQAAPSGLIATAPLTGDVARAQALWQSYVADRCGGVASQCPPTNASLARPSHPAARCRAAAARAIAMRGSCFGSAVAIERKHQARDRLRPSRCTSCASPRSATFAGVNSAAGSASIKCGSSAAIHSANVATSNTRRTSSASISEGDRKSVPDGSKRAGASRSPANHSTAFARHAPASGASPVVCA